MATCSTCGTALTEAQVLYSEQAAIVCQKCLDAAVVKGLHARSDTGASRAAFANLFLGVVSLYLNPFFVCSIVTVINAGFVFRRSADDQKRGDAGRGVGTRQVVAALGAAIGVLSVLLDLLIFSRRHH